MVADATVKRYVLISHAAPIHLMYIFAEFTISTVSGAAIPQSTGLTVLSGAPQIHTCTLVGWPRAFPTSRPDIDRALSKQMLLAGLASLVSRPRTTHLFALMLSDRLSSQIVMSRHVGMHSSDPLDLKDLWAPDLRYPRGSYSQYYPIRKEASCLSSKLPGGQEDCATY